MMKNGVFCPKSRRICLFSALNRHWKSFWVNQSRFFVLNYHHLCFYPYRPKELQQTVVFTSNLVALRAFAQLLFRYFATLVVCSLGMCFLKARQIAMDNQKYRK